MHIVDDWKYFLKEFTLEQKLKIVLSFITFALLDAGIIFTLIKVI